LFVRLKKQIKKLSPPRFFILRTRVVNFVVPPQFVNMLPYQPHLGTAKMLIPYLCNGRSRRTIPKIEVPTLVQYEAQSLFSIRLSILLFSSWRSL